MASHMTASEARAGLPDILDRVEAGEEVTITRHGRAVAVVVPLERLRRGRATAAYAAADDLEALLAQARRSPLADAPDLTEARAEELIAEVQRGRSRR